MMKLTKLTISTLRFIAFHLMRIGAPYLHILLKFAGVVAGFNVIALRFFLDVEVETATYVTLLLIAIIAPLLAYYYDVLMYRLEPEF